MPRLLKNIETVMFDNLETTTKLVRSVEGFYGEDDYIKLGGFEALLQDFRKSSDVTDFVVPPNFGLKNNTTFTTIEISF